MFLEIRYSNFGYKTGHLNVRAHCPYGIQIKRNAKIGMHQRDMDDFDLHILVH